MPWREQQRSLLGRLSEARAQTDALFDLIRPEAMYERPIPERHRLIFYLGHVDVFDWNMVGRFTFGLEPLNESLERLLAFGIDPVDGNLPTDQPSDWPRIDEVHEFTRWLRERLDASLGGVNWSHPGRPYLDEGFILKVAIEHRLMHVETMGYLLQQMPLEQRRGARLPLDTTARPLPPRSVEVPAGTATLGQPARGLRAFGWDNEFEEQAVEVPGFSIDAYPVTNGQFLEFVESGAYNDRAFWAEDDWKWKEKEGLRHPHFWARRNGGFVWRAMFEEVPLPLAWPVYVSHAEAAAYARWKGKKLPSEAQWHRAAYGTPESAERDYPWGHQPPAPERGNFDCARWDPTRVDAHPAGASAFGVHDLLGNGWEWTSTVFAPLPGFQPFPFYPGYSADFFDGKHYVMKGGSAATAAPLLRRSFRNWFQPHYPYVYATFRLVED
jgi:ergothioneine biosynthesis protein EgtB